MDAIKNLFGENYYVYRVEAIAVTAIVVFLLYIAFSLNLFKKSS